MGYRMSTSQKYRNIATNNKVALVVDDIASRNPWRVISFGIDDTETEPHLLTPDKRDVTA